MRHPIRLALTGALCAALPLVSAWALVPVPHDQPAPPTLLSVSDPFASCTADSGQPGTMYPGTSMEPDIAVNPRDGRNIVAEWQQDRWSNGSSRGPVAAVTHDGGRTWREVVIPGFTKCGGGSYDRSTDQWLAFDTRGDLYASALVFDSASATAAILVSKSTDGGLTWSAPATLIEQSLFQYFNDKPVVTTDPCDPRLVYVSWDRRYGADGHYQVMLSRSTDGGATWEAPRTIYDPTSSGMQTVGHQIVVLPNCTLVDTFLQFPAGQAGHIPPSLATGHHRASAPAPNKVLALRSTDNGRTWTGPYTVAAMTPTSPVLPGSGQPLNGDLGMPETTVNPRTGALVTVWSDGGRAPGASDIELSASYDGGLTWLPPLRVNHTPLGEGARSEAFLPRVDIAADGAIAVTYYDFRNDPPGTGSFADYWVTTCRGLRCLLTAGAWREWRIGSAFDAQDAPTSFYGAFLGNYEGLSHTGSGFVVAYTRTTGPSLEDVYFSRVRP
jgi:hypothetical protein